VVAALRARHIDLGVAEELLPLKKDRPAQRKLLARIKKEKLTRAQVRSLVGARLHGAVVAPTRYEVKGAGGVDVRTLRSGKVRIVIDADDREHIAALLASVRKRIAGDG